MPVNPLIPKPTMFVQRLPHFGTPSHATSRCGRAQRCWVAATQGSLRSAQLESGERFFKTLKEQIIHSRIYRTVAELREAVETFVDLYNEQWLPEKNGFMSPSASREAWYARQAQGVPA